MRATSPPGCSVTLSFSRLILSTSILEITVTVHTAVMLPNAVIVISAVPVFDPAVTVPSAETLAICELELL